MSKGQEPALHPVSWKLHSWKGVWKPTHLTLDGKTTLCGHKIPKNPWAKSEGNDWKTCKNCAMLQAREES